MRNDKAPAIICDLDGTLAIIGDRDPYDSENCHLDTPHHGVVHLVKTYIEAGHWIIFVSGRQEKCRPQTEEWLSKHVLSGNKGKASVFKKLLFMRKTGDMRGDEIVKNEIYQRDIHPYYQVLFVVDDRDKVVKMWREIGLTCLQANYGNF